jgi:hypothetical protein
MPWLFYPQGKNPKYLLNKRLDWPESHSEHFGEEKKSLAPAKNCTENDPAHSLVTILTTLSWFCIN